jgi:hypothetical protein
MRAATASVDSGSTRFGCRFGSFVPSHGLAATRRSRTAALKMPATIRCTTPTVDGANVSESRFTHA